jgi:hypothetical protein
MEWSPHSGSTVVEISQNMTLARNRNPNRNHPQNNDIETNQKDYDYD